MNTEPNELDTLDTICNKFGPIFILQYVMGKVNELHENKIEPVQSDGSHELWKSLHKDLRLAFERYQENLKLYTRIAWLGSKEGKFLS
jgi:hypothetical protein